MRQKHLSVASHRLPDRGLNLQPFGVRDDAPTNQATWPDLKAYFNGSYWWKLQVTSINNKKERKDLHFKISSSFFKFFNMIKSIGSPIDFIVYHNLGFDFHDDVLELLRK